MKQKRRLSIIIVIMIALALVPNRVAYAVETPRPADVIIVIDNSESLAGTSLQSEQQAADRFCAQYNGRVAIIAVHGSAAIVQNFTNDKAALSEAISGISVGPGTNLNDGLKLVKMLVEDYARPNAGCIVIVMSDGISNRGDRYEAADGRYNESYPFPRLFNLFSDGQWQYYASAVYSTAKSITGCEIIGVRFLPNTDSHNPTEIALGRDVMRDISTLGSLDAPEMDDLSPIAIALADAINDSVSSDEVAEKIAGLAHDIDDPSSQLYVFNRTHMLPFDYSMGLPWSVRMTMPIQWSLDMFTNSASYNHELAKVGMTLCDNSYDDTGLMVQNLRTLGFDHIAECSPPDDTFHSTHFAIAYQKVIINGEEKNLIIIVVSGTSGDNEWWSNFSLDFGDNLDYDGFSIPARAVIDTLREYQEENGLSPAAADNIYLLAGHSRGAAVVNLAAKEMVYSGEALASQMFAYAFATPNTTRSLDVAKYPFIHNVVDGLDPVVRVPPYAWRYGTTYGYGKNQLGQMQDYWRQAVNPVDLTSLTGVARHFSDSYMMWLAFGQPTTAWVGYGWYYVSVDCPVDVEVRVDGITVVLIENGVVNKGVTQPDYLVWTVGYGKRLMLPDNRAYGIKITATGNGTVDYSVLHLGGGAAETEPVSLNETSLDIQADDVLEARLGDGIASELAVVSTARVEEPIESTPGWALPFDAATLSIICFVAAAYSIIATMIIVVIALVRRHRRKK